METVLLQASRLSFDRLSSDQPIFLARTYCILKSYSYCMRRQNMAS
jgi:hypothetical protein